MNEKTTFIDIERFLKWIGDNPHLFGKDYSAKFNENTRKTWRKCKKMPSDRVLNDINNLIAPSDEKFTKIDGLDLLICANNSKDHNTGKNKVLPSIMSTRKKVLMLLILGRLIDEDDEQGFLTATKEKNSDVWKYLSQFNRSKSLSEIYYYFPGRTVSCEQLCAIRRNYKNGINDAAIPDGLKELERVELVECVGENLYKLNFNGCKRFLEENK